MNIDFNGVNFKGIKKFSFSKNNSKVNFEGKKDTVVVSIDTKEKANILKELTQIGYTSKEAKELIGNYYKNNEYGVQHYNLLTQGDEDGYPMHWVEFLDRNLTPTEAVIYQAEDMDDYYMAHVQDGGCMYNYKRDDSGDGKDYDLGEANFTPLQLAQKIKQGYDIITAGMILKGRLDDDTAKRVSEYFMSLKDGYYEEANTQECEYICDKIAQNLDKMDEWTSFDRNEDGTLKSGLIEPLTKEEAAELIASPLHFPCDTASINHYITVNSFTGFDLYDMADKGLWEKSIEEIRECYKPKLVQEEEPKKPLQFKNLSEKIDYYISNYADESEKDYLEDLKAFDSSRFLSRISGKTLSYSSIKRSDDRELIQKNIQALNQASDELLNKMTSGNTDKPGSFLLLGHLLSNENLEARIQSLEDYRINSPHLFECMDKYSILDFLTDTNDYTSNYDELQEFLHTLNPYLYEEPTETPIIQLKPKEN